MSEGETLAVFLVFVVFILLLLIYFCYRLLTDPPEPLDERSVKLARSLGAPKFFLPIFAKQLTKREKWGWVLFLLILLLGMAFTRITELG